MKNIFNCWKLYVLIFFQLKIYGQPIGYQYAKIIDIDHSKVSGSSNLTDFPLLISFISNDLRNVNYGGHIQNINGYDICFTTENCAVNLYHQIEKYDPTSGELICWVRIPTLYASVNTTITLYYGNSAINSITSSSQTWASEYNAVLHLGENPENVSPQMIDATIMNNSGVCSGSMTIANSVLGKIGKGVAFDEIDDYISISDFDYTSSFTMSFWFNLNDNSGTSYQYLFSHGNFGVSNSLNVYFGEDNLSIAVDRNMLKNIFQDSNDATSTSGLDAGNLFTDGNWHLYSISVGNYGGATVYLDGIQVAYMSILGGNSYNPVTNIFLGSRSDQNISRFYGGKLDEFRISNEPKNSDWIKTEYNNQMSPETFYSIGHEENAVLNCMILPIQITEFEVIDDSDRVKLNWEVFTGHDIEYFTVQKSINSFVWSDIVEVKYSDSNSIATHSYIQYDYSPIEGANYYRIKQGNKNGKYYYSDIEEIQWNKKNHGIFPNPSSDIFNVFLAYHQNENAFLRVFNLIGEEMLRQKISLHKNLNQIPISLKDLIEGIYILEISSSSNCIFKTYLAKN